MRNTVQYEEARTPMTEYADRMISRKRIGSLEGLRAIGWIGVFVHHFKYTFYYKETWMIEKNVFTNLLITGNALVRMFFVLSGIVLSLKYFESRCYDRAPEDAAKRYFRLVPPVLVVEILACALMYFGLMKNREAALAFRSLGFIDQYNTFKPNFLNCIREALYRTFLYGDNQYVGPLWTMTYEFLGSMLVIGALAVFRQSKVRFAFYAVCLLAFEGYYNYFIIGMMVSDVYVNSPVPGFLKRHRPLILISIVAGYCLMALFFKLEDEEMKHRLLFGAGIFLLMTGVMCSDIAEKLLGNRLMVFLGSISFSAYLFHWPLIESMACGIGVKLFFSGAWNDTAACALMLSTLAVTILVAFVSKKCIEPAGNRIYGALRRLFMQRTDPV